MPNCANNFENEIKDGKNVNYVQCMFCKSTILIPNTAEFLSSEYDLPLMAQKVNAGDSPVTESVSLFWVVDDMYSFTNVGFSNTVGTTKYLTCADCDAGPIGYFDLNTKKSYVALTRVLHMTRVPLVPV